MEDDKSLQILYDKMLKLIGFEIIGIANNGLEAVKMYKAFNKKPDIILMDHRMPVKNGIEASREILAHDPSSKIIFVSADKKIKEEALELGIYDFIEKPFRLDKLINKIKEVASTNTLQNSI